ncbi:Uncharacterised protein [Bordetella pertussis]|nr:Uncharacterised protein [Bordetella pertussis]CPM12981.1 Uncharacterised protein [Bordetella pertussis]CPN76318.1 Uncharacterised protein [Bordetella pertussis]
MTSTSSICIAKVSSPQKPLPHQRTTAMGVWPSMIMAAPAATSVSSTTNT